MCNVTDTFKQIRDEICGTGTNVNHERIYICPPIEFDFEKQILSACFISISLKIQIPNFNLVFLIKAIDLYPRIRYDKDLSRRESLSCESNSYFPCGFHNNSTIYFYYSKKAGDVILPCAILVCYFAAILWLFRAPVYLAFIPITKV